MSEFDDNLKDLFNSSESGVNQNNDISSIYNDDSGNKKSLEVDEDLIEKQTQYPITKIIDIDKAKDKDNDEPITSQDIQFLLETISKQAPYDKTQIKQIFYGICSSQTSTKIHHNINSKKSGEGKSYDLKLVSDQFPESFTIKFNDITDKALYHQNGFEAVKNKEIGQYEDLAPILNEIELEIDQLGTLSNTIVAEETDWSILKQKK